MMSKLRTNAMPVLRLSQKVTPIELLILYEDSNGKISKKVAISSQQLDQAAEAGGRNQVGTFLLCNSELSILNSQAA